jgi:hypothetical protein
MATAPRASTTTGGFATLADPGTGAGVPDTGDPRRHGLRPPDSGAASKPPATAPAAIATPSRQIRAPADGAFDLRYPQFTVSDMRVLQPSSSNLLVAVCYRHLPRAAPRTSRSRTPAPRSQVVPAGTRPRRDPACVSAHWRKQNVQSGATSAIRTQYLTRYRTAATRAFSPVPFVTQRDTRCRCTRWRLAELSGRSATVPSTRGSQAGSHRRPTSGHMEPNRAFDSLDLPGIQTQLDTPADNRNLVRIKGVISRPNSCFSARFCITAWTVSRRYVQPPRARRRGSPAGSLSGCQRS